MTHSFAERVTIHSTLTIEHVMPQSWTENWKLPNQQTGYTFTQLETAAADDPIAIATERRNVAVQSIGNLTLLSQPLNSSVSNAAWPEKRLAIQEASLLPINAKLTSEITWDEGKIAERSRTLFTIAKELWPFVDL